MKNIFAYTIAVVAAVIACNTTTAQTVTLDYYFNHETTRDSAGNLHRFHYTWEDKKQSGYSTWGEILRSKGAVINSLEAAPTQQNLKGTDIYIIVDPDTQKETANPNYIQLQDVTAIRQWVKDGGVLVLLANDSANVEMEHLNTLSQAFGITFNNDDYHKVDGNHFEMGAFYIPAGHPVFKTARKIYLKELSTLTIKAPAEAVLKDGDKIIIAVSHYGKGTVFAVGDPWIYNEYCNGRLPKEYDNDKAANDLSAWLIEQAKHNRHNNK